jgi:hypothetical protein
MKIMSKSKSKSKSRPEPAGQEMPGIFPDPDLDRDLESGGVAEWSIATVLKTVMA